MEEHCVSSAKGCGFNSQGISELSKSLWIKASAKCINVNVNDLKSDCNKSVNVFHREGC